MIIILRGISGSGKSCIARNFTAAKPPIASSPASRFLSTLKAPLEFLTFSADDYFMVGNEYRFDPRLLSAAHESCLRMFSVKLEKGYGIAGSQDIGLIVDNTNTTLVEVVPYLALAQAYGHETHVITLISDPGICAMRNQHGVSYTSVFYQDLRLKQSILDWPQRLARFQQIFPN